MAGPCPEDGLLGAYIENNLLPEEKRQIEAHLVECRLCRELIAAVITSMAAVPDPQSTPNKS